jgi:hypothetical protein
VAGVGARDLSLEILDGGAFPPPRLAFWLMLAVVIVSGECRMMP